MKRKFILASILVVGMIFFFQGISSAAICPAPGCVVSSDLANRIIAAKHIRPNAVVTGKIKDGAVTSVKIADGTVTGTDIANSSITGTDIATASIPGTDIQSSSITGTQIATGSIPGTDIQSSSITGTQIATGSIPGSDIQSSSITGTQIADSSITGADIATASIPGSDIISSSITGTQIATGSIYGTDIADGTVTTTDIANGTITGTDITTGILTLGGDLRVSGADIYGSTSDAALYLWSNYDVLIRLDADADNTNTWFWVRSYVGTTLTTQLMSDEDDGDLYIGGVFHANYYDVAELIETNEELEPGDVVVIDLENNGKVVLSSEPYDTTVAGIVSTNPGIVLGPGLREAEAAIEQAEIAGDDGGAVKELIAASLAKQNEGRVPLALAGRVPCKVTAENGPIRRGDLLTTSWTPGHAMRADIDGFDKIGSVIGKALEPLESGTGVIEVLVGKN